MIVFVLEMMVTHGTQGLHHHRHLASLHLKVVVKPANRAAALHHLLAALMAAERNPVSVVEL